MNTLIKNLSKNKPYLFRQFGLVSLGVFGSYASNTFTKASDVDLVYRLEAGSVLSFKKVVELENAIRNVTGVDVVDLVNEQNMNPIVWLSIRDSLVYV